MVVCVVMVGDAFGFAGFPQAAKRIQTHSSERSNLFTGSLSDSLGSVGQIYETPLGGDLRGDQLGDL